MPSIPAKSAFQCPFLTHTTVLYELRTLARVLPPFLLVKTRLTALPSSATPCSTATTATTLELPSARRFTVRATPLSFAVRDTSKARCFRPQTARPSPSSQDDRRCALSCRRVPSRAAWLHPALPQTCRYAHHAIPRCSPPCRSLFGARLELWPQALSLSQLYICSTLLHLFMYPVTLCVLRH